MGLGVLGLPTPVYPQASSSVKLEDFKTGYGPVYSEQKQAYKPQGLPPDRYKATVPPNKTLQRAFRDLWGVPPKVLGPLLCF